MSKPLLYDIVESPAHPDLSLLSDALGFERLSFSNQRKALSRLKRQPPDVVVADFFYGYGNNYAGANVSNLDVLLRSLQRFAPRRPDRDPRRPARDRACTQAGRAVRAACRACAARRQRPTESRAVLTTGPSTQDQVPGRCQSAMDYAELTGTLAFGEFCASIFECLT